VVVWHFLKFVAEICPLESSTQQDRGTYGLGCVSLPGKMNTKYITVLSSKEQLKIKQKLMHTNVVTLSVGSN